MATYRITYTYASGLTWTVTVQGTKRQAGAHVMRSKRTAARREVDPIVAHTIEEVAE